MPANIARNFRSVEQSGLDEIGASLREHYFTLQFANERHSRSPAEYLASPLGHRDWMDHLSIRSDVFRRTVVPWLINAYPLSGASVLEIGCGTGSSTVALENAVAGAGDADGHGRETEFRGRAFPNRSLGTRSMRGTRGTKERRKRRETGIWGRGECDDPNTLPNLQQRLSLLHDLHDRWLVGRVHAAGSGADCLRFMGIPEKGKRLSVVRICRSGKSPALDRVGA